MRFIQKNMIGKKKAILLLSVIIVFLTLGIIGTGLVSFSFVINLSACNLADEAKALYLAEAAISQAVFFLQTQLENTNFMKIKSQQYMLGSGYYDYEINLNSFIIIGTGHVNDIKRTIQMGYRPL